MLAAVVVGVATGAVWALRKSDGNIQSIPAARASRGPMMVSISESGEVKAEQQEVITNPVRWSVIIKELAAEGTIVQEGQLIIRMECKELDDAIVDQELRVRSADDEYQTASSKLIITRKTADARIAKATQAVEDAKDDLKKYQEGEWPVKQAEAQGRILLAEGKRTLADSRLASMKEINKDPELNTPYSKSEIDGEELEVQRLTLEWDNASAEKRILEQYTHKRTVRDLLMAVEDAKLADETTRLEAETDVRLAEAAEESAKIRMTKQRSRLQELQEDAAKLTVIAKKTGLVVYETRRRAWHRPITVAVDEKIDPSQQLMIIPNMQTLQVETRVYEAVREQVTPGLPALVRLDARPGKILRGSVSKVAPLPDSQNPWLSPGVKVYPTVVKFDNGPEVDDLKPGMSAEVEIILAELRDVLSVPIAAVFADGEETYCFRVDDEGNHHRTVVTLGRTSETRAQILSGLSEDDTVLLAPPPGVQVGKKLKDEEEQEMPPAQPDEPTTRPSGDQRRSRRPPDAGGQTTRPSTPRPGAGSSTPRSGGRRGSRDRAPRGSR